MTDLITALPMYDWPEVRAETDANWARLRDALRTAGVDAPDSVVRRNAEMAPVPSGVQGPDGSIVAPDPASLPPDGLDYPTLWRHPRLLFAQTCWGPMEQGLEHDVEVVGQPDYSAFAGGQGVFYSSAIVMRNGADDLGRGDVAPSESGRAQIPVDLIRGERFAFNSMDSMSGMIALTRDLETEGLGLDIFAKLIESGGHRSSIVAVASGRADVAAIDCLSWSLAQRFEPATQRVRVVGWTGFRKGLPFITSRHTDERTKQILRELVSQPNGLRPAG